MTSIPTKIPANKKMTVSAQKTIYFLKRTLVKDNLRKWKNQKVCTAWSASLEILVFPKADMNNPNVTNAMIPEILNPKSMFSAT